MNKETRKKVMLELQRSFAANNDKQTKGIYSRSSTINSSQPSIQTQQQGNAQQYNIPTRIIPRNIPTRNIPNRNAQPRGNR